MTEKLWSEILWYIYHRTEFWMTVNTHCSKKNPILRSNLKYDNFFRAFNLAQHRLSQLPGISDQLKSKHLYISQNSTLSVNSSNDYESWGDKINENSESPGMAKPNSFVYSLQLAMGIQYHSSKADCQCYHTSSSLTQLAVLTKAAWVIPHSCRREIT